MTGVTPHDNDVLFGRGFTIKSHPGNGRLRSLVQAQKPAFLRAMKSEKRNIARSIVDDIEKLDPPGRFLMEDPNNANAGGNDTSVFSKVWICVENREKVVEKVMHRLREKEGKTSPSASAPSMTVVPIIDSNAILQQQPIQHSSNNGKSFETGFAATSPVLTGAKTGQSTQQMVCVEKEGASSGREAASAASSSTASPALGGDGDATHGAAEDSHQQQLPFSSDEYLTFLQNNIQQPNENDSPIMGTSQAGGQHNNGGQVEELVDNRTTEQHHHTHSLGMDARTINSNPILQQQEQFILQDMQSIVGGELADGTSLTNNDAEGENEKAAPSSTIQEDEWVYSVLEEWCGVDKEEDGKQKHAGEDSRPAASPSTGVSDAKRDMDVGTFMRDFSSQHDQQLRELPLRRWTKRANARAYCEADILLQSTSPVSEYVNMALPLALKLTAFLINAEMENEQIHVPQSSITAENVVVRVKEQIFEVGSARGMIQETIEDVWITTSSMEEKPDSGGEIMPQLFALGIVLYELFSGEEPPLSEDDLLTFDASSSNMLSLNLIHLSNEANSDYHPRQKSQRQSVHTSDDDKISTCIARLESKGIPWALCALVHNLLDCSKGDFRKDEAYASLADLQLDLQLMYFDPSRFLDNIETSPLPPLTITNKLYGREDEIAKLKVSYQQFFSAGCRGIIVKGGAGVGKSRLAIDTLQSLTNQRNGYFLAAKFDQNQDVKPLSTVGTLFSSLCDLFAQDATQDQLKMVNDLLESALGDQAGLLAGVVPSLSKLMPSCAGFESSSGCVDSALSMQFLFTQLLNVISSLSKPISLLLDDMQWADIASLLLVGNLISVVIGGSKPVFFAFCYRDDEVGDDGPFNAWLSSITMFPLEAIKLENMTAEDVNNLVSDALHLSPRITRPLSSILHRKTGGNPLFLRQLMHSLNNQNHIRVQLNPPQWVWDLNEIMDLKISDDVVAFLLKDMQRLPTDLRLGLEVASCFGSCVKCSALDILSKGLRVVDLQDILQQVSKRGFVDNIGGTMFRFAHDKIQQAAYELMSEEKRRANHIDFGLHLSLSLSNDTENDELFFLAVNQMNRGGPNAVLDPSQKFVFAGLNLRAGRRAIDLSDYNAAFQLFQHGISFLGDNHWAAQYDLSLDLFDAAAEAACVLDRLTEVNLYSMQLFDHAKCFDDKLNCLCVGAKALRQAYLLQEAMDLTFDTLLQAGEELPRAMGDVKLTNAIQRMNDILQKTADDHVLNMQQTNNKKIITLQKIYSNLGDVLIFIKPSLICAVSLRMVELTISEGLTPNSPLAFAYYGQMLVVSGNLAEGCRLGRLALKLCEKKDSSAQKSSVIAFVHFNILWASEPLQSSANAHLLGQKCGQQSGDLLYANLNWILSIGTSYIAGQSIVTVQENCRDFITEMQRINHKQFLGSAMLYHSQCLVLKEGVAVLDAGGVGNIPTERDVIASADFGKDKVIVLAYMIHQLMRAFLFGQLNKESLDINVLGTVLEEKHPLRPPHLVGIFFEGLACFQLARQSNNDERWKNGETVLEKMKLWSQHSTWNFENKMLLLEAEKMHTLGDFDNAASLYERSIQSAREHKFIHEEAIASELAGLFFLERGLREKSLHLFLHSIWSYKTWGALAVAKRVETFIVGKFDSVVPSQDMFDCLFESSGEDASSKKRLVRE